MTGSDSRRNGLILSGGGAYAAYEVGVVKALVEGRAAVTQGQPLDPSVILGSSAGAMNACVLVAYDQDGMAGAVEHLEKLWLDRIADASDRCGNGVYRIRGLPFYAVDPDCLLREPGRVLQNAGEDAAWALSGVQSILTKMAGRRSSLEERLLSTVNLSGFVSTKPLARSFEKILPLERFQQLRRGLRIVATNLSVGQLVTFTEEDVRRFGHQPLLASMALPAFFPAQEFDRGYYIDGASLSKAPLRSAIREADTFHLVYMDPDVSSIPDQRLDNTIDVIDRTLVVHYAYALNKDLRLMASINRCLELLDSSDRGRSWSEEDRRVFLTAFSRVSRRERDGKPYRRLLLHRYHPSDDLGDALGLMNIGRAKLQTLIQRGYDDVVRHDCLESGCLLPEGTPPTRWHGTTDPHAAGAPVSPSTRRA